MLINISKSSRLSHINPALQGTGATVVNSAVGRVRSPKLTPSLEAFRRLGRPSTTDASSN